MPWTLRFWSSSATPPVTWNSGGGLPPQDVSASQESSITTHVNDVASRSTLASARLNAFGQDIRFGYDAGNVGQFFSGSLDDYVLIDVIASAKMYFFNTFGELVPGDIGLTIFHELAHIYLSAADPVYVSELAMNAANFDFRGPVIDEQNAIATNGGLSKQIQASYFAALEDFDPLFANFTVNDSYTGGREIDIARIGTTAGDDMNHSNNTLKMSDLIFGLDGNDIITSGNGDDFLYGGDGNDTLDGGVGHNEAGGLTDGYDFLYGEAGDDILYGGPGDTLSGGSGDDTFYLFTGSVVQLVENGVALAANADPRYLDDTRWLISTMEMGGVVHDAWAIPIVTITDLEAEDRVYVDGKLITGKSVTLSVDDGAYVSGTFSWMTPLAGDFAPYRTHDNIDELGTIRTHHLIESYMDPLLGDPDNSWDHGGGNGSASMAFVDRTVDILPGPHGIVSGNLLYTSGLVVSLTNPLPTPLGVDVQYA